MPPERSSKPSKRSPVDGTQLVWTVPVEPTSPSSIAFAPNVTPGTFNDPPPMVDPPCESILFPPPTDSPAPRRPGHSKKKPENHIPRPPNAFILFRSSFIKSQHVSTEVETNHSTLSKIIGLTWQNLPHDERQVWHAKAKAALDEHKRKFPQYAFRPLHTKGRGPEKRKVREVGPKDLKRCAKIAELLVEGKKGTELDAAVQEFDRHHVPEVVTRFEAPLTAKQYRRSSSAPIPEHTESFLSSSASDGSAPARCVRASSSQPMRRPSPTPATTPKLQQVDAEAVNMESFYPAQSSFAPSPAYSFTPEPPSFDLNAFSFGAANMLSCSTHSDSSEAMSSIFDTHSASNPTHPSLSINTSFLDDWTRSSSPMSMSSNSMPTTPESYSYSDSDGSSVSGSSSPSSSCLQTPLDCCTDHFTTSFSYDAFDPQLHQPCPTIAAPSPFHLTQSFDGSLSSAGENFASGYSNAVAGAGVCGMKSADNLDLDFAAFLSSLPPCHL